MYTNPIIFGIKVLQENLMTILIRKRNWECLRYFIESKLFIDNKSLILNNKDNNGWNVLYYLLKYASLDLFLEIYLKGYMTKEMFE